MATTRRQLAAMACGLLLNLAAGAAYAEVVVVVARDSAIETLSPTDLRDIYLGRLDRLPNGVSVTPIDQAESAPAYAAFYRRYLDQSPAQIKAHWSKRIFTGRGQPPRSVENGATMARTIAGNPDAIGYLDAERVDERLRVVRIE